MYYTSKALTKGNYNTTKTEALGLIYAVNIFKHYLLRSTFFFHVDHQALAYIENKAFLVGKMVTWMLILQEFDFAIHHIPSKKMQ